MPSLMATIGLDVNPMRRELASVQRMAQQAGANMNRGLSGGGHVGQSGIIRESIVLMREISAGNFTRVPGSLSILLQRMGILKFILKDTAGASQVLADAWQAQSVAASLAAVAATRKAAASMEALYAEGGETEATLAAAAADEEKAAAAIANARATQMKAVAAQESAAAAGAEATTAIGPLGVVAGILIGLAVGGYAAYKLVSALKEKLSGLKPADFNPEYIAKHLKAQNAAAEGQKEINKEIQKSVDLYNSASKAAERVATATKEHFDHLRKLNEFEHDPKKKAAKELEIDQQERLVELSNKIAEQKNLELEGTAKKRQADSIQVSSKESDKNLLDLRKKEAEEAREYLKQVNEANNGGDGSLKKKLFRAYNSAALSGVSGNDLDAAEKSNSAEAHRRIKAYEGTVDDVAARDEIRKHKEELTKQAGESLSKSATMGLDVENQKRIDAQKNADEAAEKAAELAAQKHPQTPLDVNSNQRIGAYASLITNIPQQTLTVTQQMAKDIAVLREHAVNRPKEVKKDIY